MKLFIGGEVENEIYEKFRIVRNDISDKAIYIKEYSFIDIEELSFYVYILKDVNIDLRNKYIKKSKRIEIEIQLNYIKFEENDNIKNYQYLKNSILDRINKYYHKEISSENIRQIFELIERV